MSSAVDRLFEEFQKASLSRFSLIISAARAVRSMLFSVSCRDAAAVDLDFAYVDVATDAAATAIDTGAAAFESSGHANTIVRIAPRRPWTRFAWSSVFPAFHLGILLKTCLGRPQQARLPRAHWLHYKKTAGWR